MSKEAMQLALEALELYQSRMSVQMFDEAVKALRQALQTEQEPFEFWSVAEGWVKIDEVREHFDTVGCGTIYKSAGEGRSPLYTAPPKQWVGLTTDETQEIFLREPNWEDFACAIQAKLKEKNKW